MGICRSRGCWSPSFTGSNDPGRGSSGARWAAQALVPRKGAVDSSLMFRGCHGPPQLRGQGNLHPQCWEPLWEERGDLEGQPMTWAANIRDKNEASPRSDGCRRVGWPSLRTLPCCSRRGSPLRLPRPVEPFGRALLRGEGGPVPPASSELERSKDNGPGGQSQPCQPRPPGYGHWREGGGVQTLSSV